MPTNSTTPTPRCGFCNAQGINYLEAKTVGCYAIVFCAKCGAIHGVIPAPQQPARPAPVGAQTAAPPPEPFDLRKVDIEQQPPMPDQKLTPARAQAMAAHYIQPGSTMYRVIRKDDEEAR